MAEPTLPGMTVSVRTIQDYVAYVNRLPTLTPEEELQLARKYRDTGDREAAKKIILANLRYVVPIAKRYLGYGLPLADLIQEGNIGLLKALHRFDPEQEVRFISFAIHWIRAEIHEFILRNWRIVKVATTKAQRKIFFNLRKKKRDLSQMGLEEAQEIAEELGVKVETVQEMEERLMGQDIAFDGPSEEEEGSPPAPAGYLTRFEADDPAEIIAEDQWDHHLRRALFRALAKLDERSRDIVEARWLREERLTLQALAIKYGVSAERIRQIEKSALQKLQRLIALEQVVEEQGGKEERDVED